MVHATSVVDKTEEPVKFLIVGLSGVGVNYTVLFICISIVLLTEPIAIAIAIIISMSSNYLFNRIWTFDSKDPIISEYIRFVSSNSLGALIQYLVALFVIWQFDQLGIDHIYLIFSIPVVYIASGIGIGIGFVSNFLFSKYFVFLGKNS